MAWQIAAGIGTNLLHGLIKSWSERARLRKLKKEQMAALLPLEQLMATRAYGLSESMGNIERGVTKRTIGGLAERGLLDSSAVAPSVAEAVAPIEAQAQQRQEALMAQIAAAKMAIAQGTSLPGFGEAFGGAMGDVGEVLSMMGGRKMAREDLAFQSNLKKEEDKNFIDLMRQYNEDMYQGGGSGGEDRYSLQKAMDEYLRQPKYR